MPRPDPLTPAVQAAFLAELRGGALVEAAAAAVGVAVSTLYARRRRDPGFDSAWAAAAEASFGWELRAGPGPGAPGAGPAELVRLKRRLRFGGARRAEFLRWLERTCNLRLSAERAGVDLSTVHRHRRRDPGFELDCVSALEAGSAALLRRVKAERASKRPLEWWKIDSGARPTEDFDHGMKLLRRLRRPDGTIGLRFVSRAKARRWDFEDALDLLERKLRWRGVVAGDLGGG